MQLTKQYLASKYDYNPRNESFHYKEQPNKRVDWNRRYAGKEVKPLKVGNVKYMTVNNAIYPIYALIKLWEEGENERLNPTSIEELLKKEAKRKATISSMSLDDLKSLQQSILNDEPYTISNRKAKKQSPEGSKKKVVTRASDVLKVNDLSIKESNKLPNHIYYDEVNKQYYVKIIYKNRKILHFDIDDINEALKVRDQYYNEVIESEK